MRARIRDTEIYFDIDGLSLVPDGKNLRERPTAFLVPGGPGTDHVGAKVRYGALASKMQLVFFDHRGQGFSARGNPAQNTLDENVEDMEALRRHLGLGRIVSIGVSYGGVVALAHALRHPRSISHLILIATMAHSGYVERARQLVAERGSAEQIAECENLFCGRIDTPDKMRRYFEVMGPLYSRTYHPGHGVGQGATRLEPQPLNLAHGPSGFLRCFDLRPQLARITVPTLIVAGRHDWICAPEFSEEMHRLIPHSDLRIFENSSHSVGGDEPEQLLDLIAGFLVYRHAPKDDLAAT